MGLPSRASPLLRNGPVHLKNKDFQAVAPYIVFTADFNESAGRVDIFTTTVDVWC